MAKRKARPHPDRGVPDLSALDRHPPPQVFHRRLELRRWLSVALLCLLTVVLLSVSFEPHGLWYLAYVAMVPWVLGVAGGVKGRTAILWGWLAGLVFWAANLYWLWWVTPAGYAALAVYLSVYWLVAAWLIRRAAQRQWPTWLTLPVIWVATEYARAYVISGFPWFFLAHTQYRRTLLIQICDVTGQYGVSFLVLMVNGAIADLLAAPLFLRGARGRARPAARHFVGLAASVLAAAGMLAYGHWRVNQETRSPGPVIGIVQGAFPVWLGPTPKAPDPQTQSQWDSGPYEVFDAYYSQARAAFAHAGCDLVVWPETVLPRGMNRQVLEVDPAGLTLADARSLSLQVVPLPASKLRNAQPSQLRRYLELVITGRSGSRESVGPGLRDLAMKLGDLSKEFGCPILAGGSTVHRNPTPLDDQDLWVNENSALWFDRSWLDSAQYAKVHLVPFSEYVPFKYSWPWLHRKLRGIVPDVMSQVQPGKSYRLFDLVRGDRKWRLATPICYEGTFARVCRRMVFQDGHKAADMLVNISNDGWFAWPWRPWMGQGSAEHRQHLVQYCFRAVENRVPVVRAVNTGISASIDSNGRIVAEVRRGGRATMVSGTLLLKDGAQASGRGGPPADPSRAEYAQVLVDSRVSLYSKGGDVFAQAVSLAATVMTAWMLFGKWLCRCRGTREGVRA